MPKETERIPNYQVADILDGESIKKIRNRIIILYDTKSLDVAIIKYDSETGNIEIKKIKS